MPLAEVVIWDADGMPPSSNAAMVLWRGFSDGVTPNVISIPRLIEENADTLRARYLAWIFDLGETRIKGLRVVDYLELRPGFNYWWMSLLVEKCNYSKSPQIDDAIRLMAFTDWATSNDVKSITLKSANQPLAECMRLWCEKVGFGFEWQRQLRHSVCLSLVRRVYHSLPLPLQALAALLKYLVERNPLRGVGLTEWQKTNGRVTFFSYFLNLVPEATKSGRYESRYWGQLPDALQADGCVTNWLHIYLPDPVVPSSSRAANTLTAFNKGGQRQQIHATLDTFLSFSVIFAALCDWCRLAWRGWRLQRMISSTTSMGLDLWPLFASEWRHSTSGPIAILSAVTLSLFNAAMKSLPKQQSGVYLQENQAWEFGLIQAWKAAGHKRLIGCPHSSVRFWDLRYFFDSRSYNCPSIRSLPVPEQVALNGKATTDAYLAGGYPAKDLVQVEALRYLYLDALLVRGKSEYSASKKCMRLLVFGDYLPSHTRQQMRMLELAAEYLPTGTIITVKPHPACPINSDDYPGLHLIIVTEPIAKLLTECDIAYTSAVTSAAVDAYCAGVPVISVLDPNMLNMSPVRGCEGVMFATTHVELLQALNVATTISPSAELRNAFFTIDSTLPRWRKLLSINCQSGLQVS